MCSFILFNLLYFLLPHVWWNKVVYKSNKKHKNKTTTKLEINMHHLRRAMQYRLAAWAIFLYKIRRGEGVPQSQVRSLTPNFTVVAFKMWTYRQRNRQNWYFFGINLPKRGISPEAISTKFGMGSDSQARTLLPNLTIVTFKMWA